MCEKVVEVRHLRVGGHKVPGKGDGKLFWAASLVALLGNIVHLHAAVHIRYYKYCVWADIYRVTGEKSIRAGSARSRPLTVFFCVSVAVISVLLPSRNAWAISDSSIVCTVHSTKWWTSPSRHVLPSLTLDFPC